MKPRLSQRLQFSLAYVLVVAVVLSLLQSWLLAPRPVELPMSKFLELLREDKVERVALTEREIDDATGGTGSTPGLALPWISRSVRATRSTLSSRSSSRNFDIGSSTGRGASSQDCSRERTTATTST